jgi:hypothetical protein
MHPPPSLGCQRHSESDPSPGQWVEGPARNLCINAGSLILIGLLAAGALTATEDQVTRTRVYSQPLLRNHRYRPAQIATMSVSAAG